MSASLQGAAAAPAPAKESPEPKVSLVNLKSSPATLPVIAEPGLDQTAAAQEHVPAPKFQSEARPALLLLEPSAKSGGSKKFVVAAVLVMVAAVGGYLGWMKMHGSPDSSAAQNQISASPIEASPAPASVPANPPAPGAESTPQLSSTSSQATATAPSTTIQPSSTPLKPSGTTPKVPVSPSSAEEEDATPQAAVSPQHTRVSSPPDHQVASVTKSPASEPEAIQPPPPAALEVASASSDAAIAGIVSATSNHIPAPSAAGGLRVSQGVIQGLVIKKVAPIYPQQAMQMHLQGSVVLEANISKEGKITNVKTVSGDAVLARAAADAVRQWKYKPYVLNGEAVGIQTEVTVKFTLPN